MNANELADHLEKYFDSEPYTSEVATMLRQQQAEIEALKEALNNLEVFVRTEHLCGPRTNELLKIARKLLK